MLIPTAVFVWIVCVLLQGGVFTPLVRARGIQIITALLVILAAASLTTLNIQLAAGSITSATFSLPAFYSGLLLACSLLLLAPSILLLGLSSLLLISLLSSFLSTCLLYIYSRVPVLGFEYDADGALHFSAFVLTTLVGACGIGCLLVAVAGRLTSEEEERTTKEEALLASRAEAIGADEYVDIDSLQQADDETSTEQYSLNQQPISARRSSSSSSTFFSSFSSSTLCWPFSLSAPSMLLFAMSSRHLSRASIRLSVGFATCLLSALLYCLHLVPIYATKRDGILRMISLDPYLLSIHIGLVFVTFTICPAILFIAHSRSQQHLPLWLSAKLTVGCCAGGAVAGFVYWWVMGYMPAHSHIGVDEVVAEYEWYFYSAGSDALVVAAQSVPRFTLTALAWAVAKEHKVSVPVKPTRELRATREEMHEMMREVVQDRDGVRVERDEVVKAVSWSTVSLWCLALVLGAVSDGVAAFAWDEGY